MLAENQALSAKLEGAALPEDGYHALARLAWGLLLSQHAPPTARGAPACPLAGSRTQTCVRQWDSLERHCQLAGLCHAWAWLYAQYEVCIAGLGGR